MKGDGARLAAWGAGMAAGSSPGRESSGGRAIATTGSRGTEGGGPIESTGLIGEGAVAAPGDASGGSGRVARAGRSEAGEKVVGAGAGTVRGCASNGFDTATNAAVGDGGEGGRSLVGGAGSAGTIRGTSGAGAFAREEFGGAIPEGERSERGFGDRRIGGTAGDGGEPGEVIVRAAGNGGGLGGRVVPTTITPALAVDGRGSGSVLMRAGVVGARSSPASSGSSNSRKGNWRFGCVTADSFSSSGTPSTPSTPSGAGNCCAIFSPKLPARSSFSIALCCLCIRSLTAGGASSAG